MPHRAGAESKKAERLTGREVAARLGVSAPAVTQAAKAGRITKGEDGKYEWPAVREDWARNSRTRTASGADRKTAAAPVNAAESEDEVKPGHPDYFAARARREEAEAERAEHEVSVLRGDLIAVSAVERVWAQALSGIRDQLTQMRSRLGALLAAESDPFKVEQMLDAEIAQALQSLSGVELR